MAVLKMTEENFEFLKGIRVKSGSLKVYKRSDGKFELQVRRYLWNVKLYNKNFVVGSYEEAEDYLVSTKFERQLPGDLIGII